MQTSYRALLLAVLVTLIGGIAPACSSEDPKAPGQLMLVLKTDMDIPKDVSAVRLVILAGGIPRWDVTYEVGPNGTRLPGTFAIIAGDDPSLPVTVRVIAYRGAEPKVLREAVVTVPADRIATLPMPISWLCWEQAKALPKDVGEDRPNAETTCTPGDTCSAGSCVASEIESKDLPDYSPSQVFGGAGEPGALGSCFDTLACFADGTLAAVDLDDCTVEAPAPGSGETNVALLLQPGGQGICNGSTCLIPLDADAAEGWSMAAAGRLKLPSAACAEILSGDVLGVATSNGCAQKTPAIPTCGPWSSVTSSPGTFDGGAAFDAPDPCFRTLGDDGDHCGSALDADPATLYTCSGGQTTATTPCSAGCVDNDGGSDTCSGDASADAGAPQFGAACNAGSGCSGGLTCLTPDSTLVYDGEGPPGGLCTLDCTQNPGVCPIGSPCVDLGTNDFCLPSCTIGTAGSADCGGRADTACKPVNLASGGNATVCLPICGSDADCAGASLRCNFVTGQCTTAPPGTGASLGQYCFVPDGGTDAGSGCADGLCQEFMDVSGGIASQCSGLCPLGSSTACNWNGAPADAGTSPGYQACLLPAVPNATDGDLGYCTNLCNDECNDCHSSFGCQMFNNPVLEAKYGALGYCAPYWTIDGGFGC